MPAFFNAINRGASLTNDRSSKNGGTSQNWGSGTTLKSSAIMVGLGTLCEGS